MSEHGIMKEDVDVAIVESTSTDRTDWKESVLMFSAQCSEYQSEETQQRAGKRSSYDYLNIIDYRQPNHKLHQ